MSKFKELLRTYSPEGVEYQELGSLVDIFDNLRKPVARDKREVGEYPYYGANGIQGYVKDYLFDGTYLLMGEDGSVINPDRSPILTWVKGKFWVNNHAHVLSERPHLALLRYVYYALQLSDISNVVRGMPPKINQANMRAIKLPVPALKVQMEIVKILDKFTELEAELETELDARKRQFDYFTNSIFQESKYRFDEFRLAEIANCYSGATPLTTKTEYWEDGNIPWIASGEVNKGTIYSSDNFITKAGYSASSTKMVPAGSVLIALAGQGKTRGMVARTRIEACTNQSLCAIVPNDNLNPDFLYFYMRTQYKNYRAMSSGEGGRGGLNLQLINSIKIPVPSMKHQEEIVQKLEYFETMTTNSASGISAEINARRQQYEYYRNKLLTFKELVIV